MSDSSVLEKCVEDLRQVMREAGIDAALVDALKDDVPLLKQGLDSLDFPVFTVAVEKRFKIAIDEREAFSLRTLRDIAAYIAARRV